MTAPTHETTAPAHASPWRFTPGEWLFFGLMVSAGIILRWLALDYRPMHHDESLHAMYGRYFYDFPEQSFYRYNPMLHGPFLYNMLRFVYNTLGSSTWSVRVPVAVLGTLLIFLPYLARRYFSKQTVLALTAVVALSPTLIYWSRFIREDIPSLCALMLMACGVALARPQLKCFFFLFGFAWMFTIKENSFVVTAILLGYLIFDVLVDYVRSEPLRRLVRVGIGAIIGIGALGLIYWLGGFGVARDAIVRFHATGVALFFSTDSGGWSTVGLSGSLRFTLGLSVIAGLAMGSGLLLDRVARAAPDSLWATTVRYIRRYPIECVGAAILAALWFCLLFSAGFRYSEGILDGLFRESIGYWLHHHSIERIKGPFNFHVYVLSWYELPFILAFLTHLIVFYRRAPRWAQITASATLVALVGALLHSIGRPVEESTVWGIFKAKDRLDLVGLFIFLVHPFVVSLYHTIRRERALALWGYLFTANLFTYSYLGEKVPWLAIYPFVAGLIYLALYFDDYVRHHPLPSHVPWEKLLLVGGSILGVLTLIFIVEQSSAITTLRGWMERVEPLDRTNRLLLGVTVLILAAGYLEGWRRILGDCRIRTLITVVFCVYSVRAAVMTNFTYAGKANEFLSQVHTTHEFHDLVMKIRREHLAPTSAVPPRILGIGESVWPITWYLVDIPGYRFSATDAERPTFDYIFQDYRDPVEKLPAGFTAMKVPLRGWWVPDYNSMTLRRYLAYSLNHTPWNPTGFTELSFLSRRGTGAPSE